MNTRERVLKEALNCVNGEREKQYGNPEDNFKRIAKRWSLYLTELYEDEGVVIELDPIDVARMMIEFKLARANGPKDKLDNYIDMIGYSACAAEIFENGEEHPTAQPCDHIEVAEECRNCDYAEKCMGTGVCLKDTEKKCIKDKPDYKCSRKDCGKFDACMTAYQHYICNKTKEASEAINKCMCENGENILDNFADFVNERVRKKTEDPYSYAHDKLANYVSVKAKEEHIPLDNLKSIDRKFPRELEEFLDQAATDCVENGKRFLDCYKEIDELFAKYVKSSPYQVKNINKVNEQVEGGTEESIMEKANNIALDIDGVMQASKNLKDYKFDHIDLNTASGELVIHWRTEK